jgi:hypothetical protein
MQDELFSVNRAADVWERDRATLVRALRHVPPDGYAGDQPRWRASTIAGALAVKPHMRGQTGRYRDRWRIRHCKRLDDLRTAYEAGLARIAGEKDLAKRREMALALAPAIRDYTHGYREVADTLRLADDDAITARADLIWSEMMEEISEAAQWPRNGSDFFVRMYAVMWPSADGDEAA